MIECKCGEEFCKFVDLRNHIRHEHTMYDEMTTKINKRLKKLNIGYIDRKNMLRFVICLHRQQNTKSFFTITYLREDSDHTYKSSVVPWVHNLSSVLFAMRVLTNHSASSKEVKNISPFL